MKRVALLVGMACMVISAPAVEIGMDDFSDLLGPIADQTGGTGWSYERQSDGSVNSASDWDNVGGIVSNVQGRLITVGSSAKREFSGPVEGSTAPSSEREGAFQNSGEVFFQVLVNRDGGSVGDWSGVSAYDFGTERVFFGLPGGQGGAFGVAGSAPVTTGTLTARLDRTYLLVGSVDYDNDLVKLWVNPTAASYATPSVSAAYTLSNWTTAWRLGSGSRTEWDVLRAADSWASLSLPTSHPGSGLLTYEGFGSYAAGNLAGKNYSGTGQMPGGSWDTQGDTDNELTAAAETLSYGLLQTTPGKAVTSGDGGNGGRMEPDMLPGGGLHAAGLVDDVSGDIGGGNVSGTLYLSFLARAVSTDRGSEYAGLQLWRDDAEGLLVGNSWGSSRYSLAAGGFTETELSGSGTVDTNAHFFVLKLDYLAAANDNVTIFFDPDLSLAEGGQAAGIQTLVSGNASFDFINLRSGNAPHPWEYDEIRMGTTWESVTPVPEPSQISLMAGALVAFLLRRRRG